VLSIAAGSSDFARRVAKWAAWFSSIGRLPSVSGSLLCQEGKRESGEMEKTQLLDLILFHLPIFPFLLPLTPGSFGK
jgi:hypothetical protein